MTAIQPRTIKANNGGATKHNHGGTAGPKSAFTAAHLAYLKTTHIESTTNKR